MVKKFIGFVIIALAIASAVPTTRARMLDELRPIKDKVGASLVPRRVDAMANQLDVRLGRGEGLPDRFDGWLRRDYTGSEFDPWDRMYYLQTNRRTYRVGSMGPDGIQGTEDDIYEERQLPGGRR